MPPIEVPFIQDSRRFSEILGDSRRFSAMLGMLKSAGVHSCDLEDAWRKLDGGDGNLDKCVGNEG